MHILSFSKPSRLLLHYGLFAVICHACAVTLLSSTFPVLCKIIFRTRVFPMLEHSLMSFTIIFIGVLGIEYILRDIDKDGTSW